MISASTFFCIDGHTCGNPVRLVAGGGPLLQGASMSARRQDFLARHDWIRTALMFEPRGHDVMSGAILYPPCRPTATSASSTSRSRAACRCAATARSAASPSRSSRGWSSPREEGELRLDTPAGLVVAAYERDGRFVERVRLTNVASWLALPEVRVDCPGLGPLVVDIAYGGNFYAIVEPQPGFAGLDGLSAGDILRLSPELRRRVNQAVVVAHPEDPTIAGVSHVMWTGPRARPQGACPQCGVLRDGRDRPLALRHRHLGADGAARGQGPARGRRGVRPREHHRQPVRGPHRGRRPRSASIRRSSRASPAGRA